MRIAFLLAGVVLVFSLPARAQTRPAFDVSGGYSLLRDQAIEENSHGWVASATIPVYRWLSATGEGGGGYKGIPVLGTNLNLSVHTWLGGPRVSLRRAARVVTFGHLLLGAVRTSGRLLGEGDSATEFALQPGGGVDLWVWSRTGLRIGGDYRRVFADEARNQFRLTVGMVVVATQR